MPVVVDRCVRRPSLLSSPPAPLGLTFLCPSDLSQRGTILCGGGTAHTVVRMRVKHLLSGEASSAQSGNWGRAVTTLAPDSATDPCGRCGRWATIRRFHSHYPRNTVSRTTDHCAQRRRIADRARSRRRRPCRRRQASGAGRAGRVRRPHAGSVAGGARRQRTPAFPAGLAHRGLPLRASPERSDAGVRSTRLAQRRQRRAHRIRRRGPVSAARGGGGSAREQGGRGGARARARRGGGEGGGGASNLDPADAQAPAQVAARHGGGCAIQHNARSVRCAQVRPHHPRIVASSPPDPLAGRSRRRAAWW